MRTSTCEVSRSHIISNNEVVDGNDNWRSFPDARCLSGDQSSECFGSNAHRSSDANNGQLPILDQPPHRPDADVENLGRFGDREEPRKVPRSF